MYLPVATAAVSVVKSKYFLLIGVYLGHDCSPLGII